MIFREESKMYLDEGISLDRVVFDDNGECVNLIEAKPCGILSLLDEECTLGEYIIIGYVTLSVFVSCFFFIISVTKKL